MSHRAWPPQTRPLSVEAVRNGCGPRDPVPGQLLLGLCPSGTFGQGGLAALPAGLHSKARGPQMACSELDRPAGVLGTKATWWLPAAQTPGLAFWGWGCPVGPAWPGSDWPRGQWVSEQLPSPKPITAQGHSGQLAP